MGCASQRLARSKPPSGCRDAAISPRGVYLTYSCLSDIRAATTRNRCTSRITFRGCASSSARCPDREARSGAWSAAKWGHYTSARAGGGCLGGPGGGRDADSRSPVHRSEIALHRSEYPLRRSASHLSFHVEHAPRSPFTPVSARVFRISHRRTCDGSQDPGHRSAGCAGYPVPSRRAASVSVHHGDDPRASARDPDA